MVITLKEALEKIIELYDKRELNSNLLAFASISVGLAALVIGGYSITITQPQVQSSQQLAMMVYLLYGYWGVAIFLVFLCTAFTVSSVLTYNVRKQLKTQDLVTIITYIADNITSTNEHITSMENQLASIKQDLMKK
jgi:hypothetical protein